MTTDTRCALEDLARSWEQQAADIHGEDASPDDMSDFGRARWFALRECAQELRTRLRSFDDFSVVESAGLASSAELRAALAHYARHNPDLCALDEHASVRHSGCTCGLSDTVDGGPITEHVRALVGFDGLGTEVPAAIRSWLKHGARYTCRVRLPDGTIEDVQDRLRQNSAKKERI